MIGDLIEQLRSSLATSDSAIRKQWATEIVERQIPLERLMVLWHDDPATAQRFMWLIGDICELDPETVAPSLPVLFEFRDGMPFPGLPRSVAKWLWLTNVPTEMEQSAIKQLFDWLTDPNASIGCKSYTAKALQQLALDQRVDKSRLQAALRSETQSPNLAYGSRMKRLLMTLEK